MNARGHRQQLHQVGPHARPADEKQGQGWNMGTDFSSRIRHPCPFDDARTEWTPGEVPA